MYWVYLCVPSTSGLGSFKGNAFCVLWGHSDVNHSLVIGENLLRKHNIDGPDDAKGC